MLLSTIMMTVPERLESCRLSLESARQAGFDPTVICDVNREGPYPTFAKSLRAALDSNTEFVAVLQDDIVLSLNVVEYMARSLNQDSFGVWSLFTSRRVLADYEKSFPAVVNGGSGWFRCRVPYRADGAQAYVLATRTARLLLQNLPHPEKRIMVDHWVGMFCLNFDVPYWCHAPSLCQHRLPESSTLDDAGVEWCRVASSYVHDARSL